MCIHALLDWFYKLFNGSKRYYNSINAYLSLHDFCFNISLITCLIACDLLDSTRILSHARLRKTSESLDFSDEGHVGTVSFRPSYSSVLQKYSLHVDEQGTIDASSSYFPIAFDDYVPGLIKVSTFARVLSLVLPSPEVQFPF